MLKRLLYISFWLIFPLALPAQNMSDLNKRLQRAEEEIAYIDKLLKKNSNDQKNSIRQLELAQKKIKSRKQMIADMDAQIHLLENDLNRKQGDIAGLQSNLDVLKKSYEELLYQAYKNRDKRLWLMYILSSDDVGLAYRRWQYFKNYSGYINEQAMKIRKTSDKLSTEITSLSTKRETLAQQKNAREKEVRILQKEEVDAERITKSLRNREKELSRKLDDQRRAVERINRQIEKIIAEQTKRDQQRRKETPNLPAADKALSAGFENNRGNLPWPVRKGVITERFGQHYHPVYKSLKLPPNNGIDIATDENAQALCVFEGVVRQVFMIPGMNNCVMVQHGEYYTLYCKLSHVNIKVGDKLSTGQVMGAVFTTDNNTVIHFEVWKDAGKTNPDKLNPELWLKR